MVHWTLAFEQPPNVIDNSRFANTQTPPRMHYKSDIEVDYYPIDLPVDAVFIQTCNPEPHLIFQQLSIHKYSDDLDQYLQKCRVNEYDPWKTRLAIWDNKTIVIGANQDQRCERPIQYNNTINGILTRIKNSFNPPFTDVHCRIMKEAVANWEPQKRKFIPYRDLQPFIMRIDTSSAFYGLRANLLTDKYGLKVPAIDLVKLRQSGIVESTIPMTVEDFLNNTPPSLEPFTDPEYEEIPDEQEPSIL